MSGDKMGWEPTEIDGVHLVQRNGLFDVGTPPDAQLDPRFTKVIGFWAPQRWLTPETMDVEGIATEIEELVHTRGMITYDGQVITSFRRAGPWKACFEAVSIDTPLDVPQRRLWGPEQIAFFGVGEPYQMADDPGPFTWSNLSTGIVDPYLTEGESIAGVVHGGRERCYFTCPCHYAHVVYTTRHRLVCMSCGATHVVLREPVLETFRQTVAAEEWDDLFGTGGSRHHEALDLVIVDVQDIECAGPYIWSTAQWEQALDDYVLRTRATPEEYERAIRGTERDASIYLEAGFQPVPEPPAPAFQIMGASIDVDMMDGAEHVLVDGAAAYLAAYVQPERLIDATKDLFQAIELLLKVRLDKSNPLGLRDRPNNPIVIGRLADVGVMLSADEMETISRLRRLRNDLQHSAARFSQRAVLALCRKALILIDRFVVEELNTWAGDVIASDDWYQLLVRIEEIHTRAVTVSDTRLADYRTDAEATISVCARCSHSAMLRPHPNTGASCLLCGHVPTLKN